MADVLLVRVVQVLRMVSVPCCVPKLVEGVIASKGPECRTLCGL